MNLYTISKKDTLVSNNINDAGQVVTGEILADVRINSKDGKERPWRAHKKLSMRLASAYDRLGLNKSDRVHNCGSYLLFKECSAVSSHPKTLKHADFCRDRLCPTCNWRRSLLLGHQVHETVTKLLEVRKTRFIFLTLTTKNVSNSYESLSGSLDDMFSAFKRMAETLRFKTSILGYYRALEVSYNKKTNTFHPHFHILLAVEPSYFDTRLNKYIKQAEWSVMWQNALRVEYMPVCDVRIVKPNKKNTQTDHVGGAIAEIAKYAIKSADIYSLSDEKQFISVIDTLNQSLKNRRLVSWGGILKKIAHELILSDINTADLVHTGEELSSCTCPVCQSGLIEHIYRWREVNYVG